MGYAEQLATGEGHFANLFDRVPAESHGLNNNSNTTQCRLKVKQILMGRDAKPWFTDEHFAASSLTMSTVGLSAKLFLRNFY